MSCTSFSFLIMLDTNSPAVLSRKGKRGPPCTPDLRRKGFSPSPVSVILSVGFFTDARYQVKEVYSYS